MGTLAKANLMEANLAGVLLKVEENNLTKFYYGHYKISLIFKYHFKEEGGFNMGRRDIFY